MQQWIKNKRSSKSCRLGKMTKLILKKNKDILEAAMELKEEYAKRVPSRSAWMMPKRRPWRNG